MEIIQCPKCGSNDVHPVATPEYQCGHCGTRLIPAHTPYKFVDVVLNQAPQGKNQGEVIKALRRATFLDETTAKIAINNLPWVIQKNLPLDEGVRIRVAIEAAGGRVTLKPRITPSD